MKKLYVQLLSIVLVVGVLVGLYFLLQDSSSTLGPGGTEKPRFGPGGTKSLFGPGGTRPLFG